MQRPELLAPAGSAESLTAALRCGADAVYLGAKRFSARANAENFADASLHDAALLCRSYGAKLYLAVNTLLLDREFSALDSLLETLAEIGADGCIVQDLGAAAYMAKRLPTLRLHASTQLTVHTPAGVHLAKQVGFCRVVLARELSEMQLRETVAEAGRIGMETEVFVHGAHCMCVSGECFLSAAMGGRSANRGCCAQPCRLPFRAGAGEAYALSLKDQSLLAHLQTLCEIGVDSLKIEGRMKRPEYVAAAVTACRDALRGGNPDMQTLRAVFSRSGFTDGYFTGERREMFGTRQREDVTAAQDVLAPLRDTYRKPRKCAVLDAHFVLRADEPASLTVTDDAGNSATVTGAVPETAQHRPADADSLRRQFEKLGDTVFSAGNVTAEIDEGLTLPASAVNAMRRAAVEGVTERRIAANTPEHRLAEKPEKPQQCGKAVFGGFRMQIRRLDQLTEIGNIAQKLEFLMLPLHLCEAYCKGEMPVPLSRCMIVPPRFTVRETDIADRLKHTKMLGFSHLCCQNAGDIVLGQRLGMTLHGGFGLHLTNTYAGEVYRGLGLQDMLCSPEIPKKDISADVLPTGVFAYGRLPLMLMRNCPVQNQVGCAKCRHLLTDRKGAAVFVDCTRYTDSPDYAELFNAAPVWLAGRTLSGAAYALLFFTDERPDRVRAVLDAYINGTAADPPKPFTRGLHLQG